MKRWLREIVCLPIRFYQRFLSPLKPPTCRFRPTCSQYGISAIRVHGILKGTLLLIWRILRCNPFTEPGPDPVPPRGAWRAASSGPEGPPDTREDPEERDR